MKESRQPTVDSSERKCWSVEWHALQLREFLAGVAEHPNVISMRHLQALRERVASSEKLRSVQGLASRGALAVITIV